MKRIISLIVATALSFILLFLPAHAAEEVSATKGAAAIGGLQLLPNCLAKEAQTTGINCVGETITHFTNLLLWLIAVGAFLYMLYGAFLYTTAFGDESKVKSAKSVMKNALIGVFLATLANLLVDWLQQALNVTGI